jgi:hypothetical protein
MNRCLKADPSQARLFGSPFGLPGFNGSLA